MVTIMMGTASSSTHLHKVRTALAIHGAGRQARRKRVKMHVIINTTYVSEPMRMVARVEVDLSTQILTLSPQPNAQIKGQIATRQTPTSAHLNPDAAAGTLDGTRYRMP
jgi:hypothetical protein